MSVQSIKAPHPLLAVPSCYLVGWREHINTLPWWRRILVRFSYFRCKWSSDYSLHTDGVFTDRDVAFTVVDRKIRETGNNWYVMEVPVNGLLPDEGVQYGIYDFPSSDIDYTERRKARTLQAVEPGALQQLRKLKKQADELVTNAMAR